MNTHARCIARIDDSEIHECSAVDFPIGEDAFHGSFVETVHLRVCYIGGETSDEEFLLFGA